MPKPDPAHKETDKILAEMEKRLDEVYKQAYREARQTADDFMKQFREMDKKKRQKVKDGELDKAEYERWRRTQVFQGNRYHQMADTLAADMTHTNQIAASVINGYLPEVYAVNYNYGTYEIEKGSRMNTQYTMYDKQTVERLIRDNPDLLPRKAAVNVPKDQLWNKKHINSAVTQGILQGEAIDKIAQRLAATVTDMSHTSAIRNARTMTTSAQNGGRIDSYKRAEGMGIKILQQWLATLDSRTRHEHRQLDGQKRKVGEPFEVEGEKIFFPGDPAAEPYLTYNCRCTLIGEVEGVDYNLSDVSQRDSKLGDMTYEEWKEEKRKQDNAEPPAPKPEPKAEDKPAEVEVPAPTVENPDAVDETIPQRDEFKPASTIEEAEQYASRLATDVSYRGLTVDSANAINRTLTELTQLYPTKPLKELKTNNRLKRAAARANFQQIEINPNAQKESTEEIRNIFTERLKEYKKARETASYKMQKQYDKAIKQIEESLRYERFSVSSDLGRQVTIIHEYGHVIADQYFGQINSMLANPNRYSEDGVKMNKLVQDAYNKAKNSDDKYKISEYALSDKEEFFAECFAMYHLKQELPDYIEDMMKEVLKRGAV